MKYYMGIEAGGANTEFILGNSNGEIITKNKGALIHLEPENIRDAHSILTEGVRLLFERSGLAMADISLVFAGMPGYGEDLDRVKRIDHLLKSVLDDGKFIVGNDSVAGWAGSMCGKSGVHIVLGTGAICYGRDDSDRAARASGWGPFVGDEGSAYWIGKQALEIFSKISDGRYVKTPLYDIMKHHLRLKRDFDIIPLVLNNWKTNRRKIANLSKLLYLAAVDGDDYADEVFQKAAEEAFIAIQAVISRLHFDPFKPIRVSYSGEVTMAGDIILEKYKISARKAYLKCALKNPCFDREQAPW